MKCADCKGSCWYDTGMLTREPCQRCKGLGEEPTKLSKTSNERVPLFWVGVTKIDLQEPEDGSYCRQAIHELINDSFIRVSFPIATSDWGLIQFFILYKSAEGHTPICIIPVRNPMYVSMCCQILENVFQVDGSAKERLDSYLSSR